MPAPSHVDDLRLGAYADSGETHPGDDLVPPGMRVDDWV